LDAGADPNEVVMITDSLADMTLPPDTGLGGEDFSVLEAPAFDTVYRGVADAPVPEPATLTLLAVAFGGIGFIHRRR
jgi:hypothetical protein